MIRLNENYLKLNASYLFADIAKRVAAYQAAHPQQEVIKLGIGDVTRALPVVCVQAFHQAIDEMAVEKTFRGYGPEQGYAFLREKIATSDFQARGADISADEIFVSDGSKCDTGNFQELFAEDIRIAVPDPVYPVYVDTNVMAGRTGAYGGGQYQGLVYLECGPENNFIPDLPKDKVDLIYLCFPNNPTGATITKKALASWVEFAKKERALLLFDAAYVAYIRDDALPQSIYEIPGAKEVAVEFRSFSKTAGFTGMRCAYTVVPKTCFVYDAKGKEHSLHALWNRRHATKFNGVAYPVQRAAEAIYSSQGQVQVRELTDSYLQNARLIRQGMSFLGFQCVGGQHAPYIWVASKTDSWQFFDLLLSKAKVVCTPGSGFGKCGEGFVRFSAFNTKENTEKALDRMSGVFDINNARR